MASKTVLATDRNVQRSAWLQFIVGAVAAAWLVFSAAAPSAFAQQIIQFGGRFARPGQTGEDAADGPFPPPSHETSRNLEQAKKLLEDGHYSDGLQMLDDIMQRDEDFFLRPEPGGSSHRGLKEEVQRLISQQPPEGLQAYETLFGAKAQHMLSDALSANDMDGVGQVARRYFNTKAGNDATLLVGLWDLDHNQPLAAALCLERLHDVATGAAYEPSLSVLLASCWQRGGQESRARDVLVELKKKFPGATIRIGDKSEKLFSDDSQALAWLSETFGNDHGLQVAQLQQWTIFRGDPARNAISAGGMPMMDPRWRATTTENQTAAISSRQANMDRNIPILPVMQPLAVENVVLMRTASALLAIDFTTGKRIWQVGTTTDAQAKDMANVQRFNGMQQGDPSLGERLWENATLGTMASDGQYVFMVEDPKPEGVETEQQRVMVRQFGVMHSQLDGLTNVLAAYELRTQGKFKWQVGGRADRRDFEFEPKLAGAYFLGPPLPLDGQLYVLAELKGEIALVVLDAKTGKLQWQQQLVSTDSNMNVYQDSYRRLTGATPSFADGVLVCPTSAGAIVAVDLATHKLLWGYEYPQSQTSQQQVMNWRWQMVNGGIAVPSFAGDRWADSTATVADGRVLVTPVEGDQPLYCLSLIDGKLLWKMDRTENLYVAGVQDGKVILVGKRKIDAVSLADNGRLLWSLDLDSPAAGAAANSRLPQSVGAMPSGRGFFSRGCYFLPLSTAEIACVDISQGKIISRTRSRKGFIPGNLICYKDDVISLGVDSLDAFFQLEPLGEQTAEKLKKNPDDPIGLTHRGQIALNAGRLADAIRDIRLAYEKGMDENSRAVTRGLLVDAMLAALRSDFNGSRVSINELEKLISLDSEQAEFLRMLADGLQKSGDRLAAVDAYLKLADLKWGQGEPESIDQNLSVRRDRWVEARMESLYAGASPAERAQIDSELSARLKSVVASKNDKDLRSYVDYFTFHPTANVARAELARLLTANETALERQLLYSELERSGDESQRREATADLAELLRAASRPEEAAVYYHRLNSEFADQVCLDGKTGKQIVEELPPDSPEVRALAQSKHWPSGAVKHDGGRNAQGMNFQRPIPIPWQGDRGPFFQTTTVLYDMQQQIVGRDGMGNEKFRIPLSEAGQNRFGYQPITIEKSFATAKGHLLFVNLGSQLLALDTLRPMNAGSRVLWQQELFDFATNAFSNGTMPTRQVPLPWGATKQISQANDSSVLGIVGPITDRCVCLARSHDLLALDPLTGAQLWVWHGLPQNAEVFGDDDSVIVARPDGQNAVVLRTADGLQLGTCNIPPIERRASYHGRRVLTWRDATSGDGKIEILLADPWKGQDLVLGDFKPGMRGTIVDDQELAILETSGRFHVFSLDDGRKLVDEQLALENEVEEISLQATPDQFILVAKRPDRDHAQVVGAPYMQINTPGYESGLQSISGSVYAFSRATGKQSWSVPAQVEHVYIALDQGQELPVLLMVRIPSPRNPQNGGESKGAVLCLDRRTGRALVNEDVMMQMNNYHYSMKGDRQTNSVALNIANHTFNLTFTDEPVAPEPPFQSHLARLAQMKAPLSDAPLKSLFGHLLHSGDDSGEDDSIPDNK